MKPPFRFLHPIALLGLLVLGMGFQNNAQAGVCVIKGQGLVAAYTLAEQGGYRINAYHRMVKTKMRPKKLRGVYVVPGKLGVKGRIKLGGENVTLALFRKYGGNRLLRGWKITRVNYGGSPTAVSSSIENGTVIRLSTRDPLSMGKKFNFYVTSFRMEHPSPSRKCGNDPISQQIVLQQAFKG